MLKIEPIDDYPVEESRQERKVRDETSETDRDNGAGDGNSLPCTPGQIIVSNKVDTCKRENTSDDHSINIEHSHGSAQTQCIPVLESEDTAPSGKVQEVENTQQSGTNGCHDDSSKVGDCLARMDHSGSRHATDSNVLLIAPIENNSPLFDTPAPFIYNYLSMQPEYTPNQYCPLVSIEEQRYSYYQERDTAKKSTQSVTGHTCQGPLTSTVQIKSEPDSPTDWQCPIKQEPPTECGIQSVNNDTAHSDRNTHSQHSGTTGSQPPGTDDPESHLRPQDVVHTSPGPNVEPLLCPNQSTGAETIHDSSMELTSTPCIPPLGSATTGVDDSGTALHRGVTVNQADDHSDLSPSTEAVSTMQTSSSEIQQQNNLHTCGMTEVSKVNTESVMSQLHDAVKQLPGLSAASDNRPVISGGSVRALSNTSTRCDNTRGQYVNRDLLNNNRKNLTGFVTQLDSPPDSENNESETEAESESELICKGIPRELPTLPQQVEVSVEELCPLCSANQQSIDELRVGSKIRFRIKPRFKPGLNRLG